MLSIGMPERAISSFTRSGVLSPPCGGSVNYNHGPLVYFILFF